MRSSRPTATSAADGVEAVEVEYEPLRAIVDPFKALASGAPVIREDIKDKKGTRSDNLDHIFTGRRATEPRPMRCSPRRRWSSSEI